jgi:hypothetical protein
MKVPRISSPQGMYMPSRYGRENSESADMLGRFTASKFGGEVCQSVDGRFCWVYSFGAVQWTAAAGRPPEAKLDQRADRRPDGRTTETELCVQSSPYVKVEQDAVLLTVDPFQQQSTQACQANRGVSRSTEEDAAKWPDGSCVRHFSHPRETFVVEIFRPNWRRRAGVVRELLQGRTAKLS